MDISSHVARVVGPISYTAKTGRKRNIPTGPCLVEALGGRSVDVIWGAEGQSSVAMSVEEIEAALDLGNLVFLD